MIENKGWTHRNALPARRLAWPAAPWACLLLAAALPCLAQDQEDERRKVEAVPARIDFGERGHNERPEAELIIQNFTSRNVVIFKIEVSCDCIQVTPRESMRLRGGDAATFKVSMGSGRAMGLLAKKITITTSDPGNPEIVVPVLMRVLEGYELNPSSIQFTGIVGGKPVEAVLDITRKKPPGAAPAEDFRLEVDEIAGQFGLSKGDYFKSSISPIPGGKRLTVVLDSSHPEGRIAAEIRARVNGKTLIVPITGEMFAWILVQPTFINFSPARPDDPRSLVRESRLSSTDGTPFSILKVDQVPSRKDDPSAKLAFTVSSAPSKKAHTLTVQLEPGEPGARRQSFFGQIIVTTDHPKKPQVILRYSGFFPSKE